MMEDRKGQKTYDRLYKKGYESLREKSLKEYESRATAEESFNKKSPSRGDISDPNVSYHRGKPARTALYELHTDILRAKQEALM
jgi:hypothetical protein